jgi:hypothetical protein
MPWSRREFEMDYLKHYRDGEYEQIWDEMNALGGAVFEEPHFSGTPG